jgi:hypothetical protein
MGIDLGLVGPFSWFLLACPRGRFISGFQLSASMLQPYPGATPQAGICRAFGPKLAAIVAGEKIFFDLKIMKTKEEIRRSIGL